MEDVIKVSRGVEVSKIGKKYYFEGQCEWSKKKTLPEVGFRCAHNDCWISFYKNLGIEECRQQLLALTLEK